MSLTGTEMQEAWFQAQRQADLSRVPQCIVAVQPGLFSRKRWRVEATPRSTDTVIVRDIKPRAHDPEFADALRRAYHENAAAVEALRPVAPLALADASGNERAYAKRLEFMMTWLERINQLDLHMLKESA